MILKISIILVMFLSTGGPKYRPKTVPIQYRHCIGTVLGTVFGTTRAQKVTKIIEIFKIMKNPDFGMLEMLFCC